jgi:hypothetical protein
MSKTSRLPVALLIAGFLFGLSGLTLAVVSGQDTPAVAPTVAATPVNLIPLPPTLSGTVVNKKGPVAGAIVQVQGTPNRTQTTDKGAFTLSGITGVKPVIVTAWSAGHFIGWTTVNPSAPDWQGGDKLTITLRPLPVDDNSKYEWFSFEGVQGSASCGLCHREYPEWQNDQHARAAINHRFLNLYTGMDVQGNRGQLTQLNSEGRALPLDPNQPHYGPGFQLDMPGRAGNCAACHTPLASKSSNAQNCAWSGCHAGITIERANGRIDPPASPLAKAGAEGITCDFCHKIGDVILDPQTKMPLPDMPGILSLRLHRPYDDSEQIFFGTLVDVSRERDSYLPLLSKSAFCAGCHVGVFGGVVGMQRVKDGALIYNSYGEWLASPYNNPQTGKTCQDCHMAVSSANWFVFPEREGLTRDYAELHNHTMRGASDENFLQNAVTMKSTAQRNGDQLRLEVSITNDQTGHHVPTDSPIRSMILVVEALDAAGKPLKLDQGPVNPTYSGDYGGLPGKTFAKVLKDEWTGEAPTAAFWRPVVIVEDTRLAALATDTTRYTFAAPAGQAVTIKVRLLFRRAFYDLMKQKGWNDRDILMEHETLQVAAN